jgi:hypothetical protein
MAWSKFDPHAPAAPEREGSDAQADRRAKLLRWATIISWLFTAFGFGVIAWQLWKK